MPAFLPTCFRYFEVKPKYIVGKTKPKLIEVSADGCIECLDPICTNDHSIVTGSKISVENKCPFPNDNIIGGSRGRRRRPPPRVQILSFRHTNFTKCSRLGSWCPPMRLAPPLREILDPPLNIPHKPYYALPTCPAMPCRNGCIQCKRIMACMLQNVCCEYSLCERSTFIPFCTSYILVTIFISPNVPHV